jgi:Sugar kinases, ribokinase family
MRVLCAGLVVCDILIKPVSEECLKLDTSKADIIKLAGGGDAFNVAVNLSALGVEATLASRVGRDELGILLAKQAEAAGVNISGITASDIPTSSSVVFIHDNGQRNFLSCKGACHTFEEKDVSNELLERHDMLYVGSAFDLPGLDGEGMNILFERAARLGLKTVLDTTGEIGPRHFDMLCPSLRHVNLFLPSLREALGLSGKKTPEAAACFFHENGSKTVIIKMGREGSLVSEKGRLLKLPAFEADVIDTTGAGDAFVSGVIAAYCKGLSMSECAKFGNAAGAECVRKIGASGTLESYEKLKEYVR